MTDFLHPLEAPISAEFHRFKHAVHRAVANTTGFSVTDLADVPDKQWCTYTILTPDATGISAGWGVVDYVVINHAAMISGNLPSPTAKAE